MAPKLNIYQKEQKEINERMARIEKGEVVNQSKDERLKGLDAEINEKVL